MLRPRLTHGSEFEVGYVRGNFQALASAHMYVHACAGGGDRTVLSARARACVVCICVYVRCVCWVSLCICVCMRLRVRAFMVGEERGVCV